MTEFSPEMQQRLAASRQRAEDRSQAWWDAERARLDANRDAIDRLVQNAHALGEIALEKGIEPSAWLGHETVTTSFWSGHTTRTFDSTQEGWLLTWKGIFQKAQPPKGTPSGGSQKAARGLITMIGSEDRRLYVAETHKYLGPLSNPIDTVTYASVKRGLGPLGLASPGSSNLGVDNPTALIPNVSDYIMREIEPDIIDQAMVEFAEENRLY